MLKVYYKSTCSEICKPGRVVAGVVVVEVMVVGVVVEGMIVEGAVMSGEHIMLILPSICKIL